MDRWKAYDQFAQQHPELFVNPDGGITIRQKAHEREEIEHIMAERLKEHNWPAEWGQVGIVFEDQYEMIVRDAVHFPGGKQGTYTRSFPRIIGVPGVAVLPSYQGKILVLRHFRHATRTWHIEIPRGFGMEGFSSEECVQIELKEEIGARVMQLVSLGQVHPNTGRSMEAVELYYADIDAYGTPNKEEGISKIIAISLEEMETMIRDNEITDGFTLAAYTRAKLKGLLA